MVHNQVIKNLWLDRHKADARRTIRAVLRTLRHRREARRHQVKNRH